MAYVTLDQIKLYRGIPEAEKKDDALLTACIARAQAQIDRHCDRTFEASSTAAHYFDAVADVSDDKRTLYLDDDLCAITLITNGSGSVVNTYVTNPVNHAPYYAVKIKASAAELWTYDDDPESAITVTGYWAYSTAAPADITQATIRLALYEYAQKDASVFDVTAYPDAGLMTVPQGIPRDVKQILEPYRRVR